MDGWGCDYPRGHADYLIMIRMKEFILKAWLEHKRVPSGGQCHFGIGSIDASLFHWTIIIILGILFYHNVGMHSVVRLKGSLKKKARWV